MLFVLLLLVFALRTLYPFLGGDSPKIIKIDSAYRKKFSVMFTNESTICHPRE